MIDIQTLFLNRNFNEAALLKFGFKKSGDSFDYSERIADGQFELRVSVKNAGMVAADVTDCATGDKYVLHLIADATGEFVGKIRAEYDRILTAISQTCFERVTAFKCDDAKAVIEYVRKKYEDELEFLWEKFPENAIYRRKDNKKWYAALLIIPKNKLGIGGEVKICVIDLRMLPEEAETLIDNVRYFPGYHMNKKRWLTIPLDGSVALNEIFERIDVSYSLAKKK